MDVTVISGDDAESPATRGRAAFFRIEIVERRVRGETSLGVIVVGDVVTLRGDDGREHRVVVRRAELAFVTDPVEVPLDVLPPELAGVGLRASGFGTLVCREHAVPSGSRLRLQLAPAVRLEEVVFR